MFDTNIWNIIVDYEIIHEEALIKLKSCKDKERISVLKADIRLSENIFKHIKMDLSDEDIEMYIRFAEENGTPLKVFPTVTYTQDEEKAYRDFMRFIHTPDPELEAFIESYENKSKA